MAAETRFLRRIASLQRRSIPLHILNQAPRPAKLPDDSSKYLFYACAKDNMLAQEICLSRPWVLLIAYCLQEGTCMRTLA